MTALARFSRPAHDAGGRVHPVPLSSRRLFCAAKGYDLSSLRWGGGTGACEGRARRPRTGWCLAPRPLSWPPRQSRSMPSSPRADLGLGLARPLPAAGLPGHRHLYLSDLCVRGGSLGRCRCPLGVGAADGPLLPTAIRCCRRVDGTRRVACRQGEVAGCHQAGTVRIKSDHQAQVSHLISCICAASWSIPEARNPQLGGRTDTGSLR